MPVRWQASQVAQAGGVRPLVLTRRVDAAPFPWPETTFLEYPASPTTRAGAFVARADRKLFGYRYLGPGVETAGVAAAPAAREERASAPSTTTRRFPDSAPRGDDNPFGMEPGGIL